MTDKSVDLEVILLFHGRRGVRKLYCPSDLPLRFIPPRLAARCPPLTAAGGQGPQDNTACGLAHTRFISSMDGYTGHASGAAGSQGFARAGGVRLKEGVPTLGHVRGKDPADTSYREAMTQETPGGME